MKSKWFSTLTFESNYEYRSILTQHLCPAGAFLKGNENSSAAERQKREARYCYEDENPITHAVAVQAREIAHAKSTAAVECHRNHDRNHDRNRGAVGCSGTQIKVKVSVKSVKFCCMITCQNFAMHPLSLVT